MIDEQLRKDLVARAVRDRMLAARLAAAGTRHVGYHPEAEALHAENAAFLAQVFDAVGWPDRGRVGDDGAAAAMMLLQNAIGHPEVQRRGLELLMAAAPQGRASLLDVAYLTDRIRVFEGKPQVFGTQLDWGEDGRFAPAPMAEPEAVDARRASVGLGPLAHAVAETNAEFGGAPAPADLAERRAAFEAWARRVGWR